MRILSRCTFAPDWPQAADADERGGGAAKRESSRGKKAERKGTELSSFLSQCPAFVGRPACAEYGTRWKLEGLDIIADRAKNDLALP